MKYLLVILGFFLAFNPTGLCENDNCCKGSDAQKTQEKANCDHHTSCNDSLMHDAQEDNHSSDHNEETVHTCDFCVISMLLPSYSDLDISDNSYKPTLSRIIDKFSNRLYFSIWNPPNL